MAGPKFINHDVVNTYLSAGIDPKTGNPTRIENLLMSATPGDFLRQLRILDTQQAINRYTWYNLPSGLDGQLIERILYFKGQAMFFWMDDNPDTGGTFYFLPYALDGKIDVYGRFNSVTPLPFNGTAVDEKEVWITGLTRKVIKEAQIKPTLEMYQSGCVLISDYCKQISQTNISRSIIQEPILQIMSEIFPMTRTNLSANSGIKGMRVQTQDEESNVKAANNSIKQASISGNYFVPIVGNTDFQELTSNGRSNVQDYLMTMEAFDNYRLQLYGLKNGGIFEKSAYVNNTTAGNIQQNSGLQYQDGLTIRREFCNIVNSIFGLFIWCDTNEVVQNMDANADGRIADDSLDGKEPQDIGGGEDDE